MASKGRIKTGRQRLHSSIKATSNWLNAPEIQKIGMRAEV
jgi:hypothetical protein